jgi:GntR family transcriptional regulator
MKLWLSKSSEVSLQEQLSSQIILGIISADLAPGERLPSTAQLGRRFNIHPNTVRSAYRALVGRGWLEWRPGSGFYVRVFDREGRNEPGFDLDQLAAAFFEVARNRGHSLREIQSRMERWFSLQPPDHVLVIEPDPDLRAILMAEIKDAVPASVDGAGLDECSNPRKHAGAMCVALYDHAEQVRRTLPAEVPRLLLRSCSIPKRLAGERRPSSADIITVASRWPGFLHWARTTLAAVGLDASALDLRDARIKGWGRGLTASSFVITDSLAAQSVPKGCRPRVFKIIADESITELQAALAGS